ncbi:MAG: hypothetical protein NZ849_02260 [Meiothermus sp.]|nr:hypothetical protein [Meiothermus sp.]MCS7193728.1 hypothetical protein [Meiothermus sp.]MCX7740015.1 hypothetical protein [Meiothermus sp.]MDW8089917.1 hypothetical protein [Meiothermus sp.]
MQNRVPGFFKGKGAFSLRYRLALLAALFFLGWLVVEVAVGS